MVLGHGHPEPADDLLARRHAALGEHVDVRGAPGRVGELSVAGPPGAVGGEQQVGVEEESPAARVSVAPQRRATSRIAALLVSGFGTAYTLRPWRETVQPRSSAQSPKRFSHSSGSRSRSTTRYAKRSSATRCLRTQDRSVVAVKYARISPSGAHSSASRRTTASCQSRSLTPSTRMCPPLAQIAYFGAGPGSWMRWYCLRVRVVVGTKTASAPRCSRSRAASSVMYDSGLDSCTSMLSSRGACASGMPSARAAEE